MYAYFSYFGQVSDIAIFYGSEPRDQGNLTRSEFYRKQRSFCVVSTACRSTYANIVGTEYHSVAGRQVYCSRYEEGSKLMRQNRLNNQRRVIVRRVPPFIDQTGLQLLLEQTIGRVEVMYHFNEPSTCNGCETSEEFRRSRSYSVTFEDRSCAQLLLSIKEIQFKEYTFVVEKFKPIGKRDNQFSSSKAETQPEERKASSSNNDSTVSNSGGSNNPHFLGVPTDFVRPTSKIYSIIRSQVLKMAQPSLEETNNNLRFNQLQPLLRVALPLGQ